MLQTRLRLLEEVERLEMSLTPGQGDVNLKSAGGVREGDGLGTGVGYTCESASHFFLLRVRSLWEEFLAKCILEKQNTQSNTLSFFLLCSLTFKDRLLRSEEICFIAVPFSSVLRERSEANIFRLQRWRF